MLIPLGFNELIHQEDPVRVVHAVLDKVDISSIIKEYRPGVTSSYHFRMLLKVMVYAYINNIYSSRRSRRLLSPTSIICGWLMRKPDHNTINHFRGERLQITSKPIFKQVVLMLREEGKRGYLVVMRQPLFQCNELYLYKNCING